MGGTRNACLRISEEKKRRGKKGKKQGDAEEED